ncbi:MAG: hypothetical protein K2Y27_21870 [Xanthobacteraceae bacterium]|nr:hypothetical protein [Xanthobacteraceae bacterium]
MAIYRLFQEAAFGLEETERMQVAYESALKLLRLSDRADPITELIAKKIVEAIRKGGHDPAETCTRVLSDLGVSSPE